MVTVTGSPTLNDALVGMSRVLVFDSANPHFECAWQAEQAETEVIWTVTAPGLTAVTVPGCCMMGYGLRVNYLKEMIPLQFLTQRPLRSMAW
jgi:hypothetical protein